MGEADCCSQFKVISWKFSDSAPESVYPTLNRRAVTSFPLIVTNLIEVTGGVMSLRIKARVRKNQIALWNQYLELAVSAYESGQFGVETSY